jgi:hypothetical protein
LIVPALNGCQGWEAAIRSTRLNDAGAPKAAFICGDVKLELLIFESSLDLLTNDYELIKLRILFK